MGRVSELMNDVRDLHVLIRDRELSVQPMSYCIGKQYTCRNIVYQLDMLLRTLYQLVISKFETTYKCIETTH